MRQIANLVFPSKNRFQNFTSSKGHFHVRFEAIPRNMEAKTHFNLTFKMGKVWRHEVENEHKNRPLQTQKRMYLR